MKKIIIVLLILYSAGAINAQTTPAMALSDKIAGRMKDSLSLSVDQRKQLYEINMQLAEKKKAVFRQYSARDSVRQQLQKIESTRDSLYSLVLPADKYLLYKQKKTRLLNNN